MGLWVSILITLAVFGSILWIKPSPRERLLIEYRKAALSKGLKVRMLSADMSKLLFPWVDNYRQFVFYEKSLPVRVKPKSHKAIVVRISVDPNAHEIDAIDPIRQAVVANLSFKELPITVEALIISASGISILWRECSDDRPGSSDPIDLIDRFLTECMVHSKFWT